MEILYLLVGILVSFLIVIMLFNYIYCKYYTDPAESSSLATLAIVISMSVGLLCVLFIPIDIFLITFKGDSIASITLDRTYLKNVIFFIYSSLIFIAFVMIPFTYFYTESNSEEDIFQGNSKQSSDRFCSAIKYTLFFVFVCISLMLCGLFIKQNNAVHQDLTEFKWVKNLFDTEHRGDQAISFVISVLSILGMFLLIVYCGYGLGSLPLFLIRGKKSLSVSKQEYEFDRAQLREKIRNLLEKSAKKTLSSKEKRELNKLREDEQNLDKKMLKLSTVIESEAFVDKCLAIFIPFRVAIGIVFLTISILIIGSLFITSLDRYINSKCGLNCGFVIDEKKYTNLIDSLLLFLSRYFHLDHLAFALINVYVYICSIYGFVNIGVKFFCFSIVKIKKKATLPQGLLIGSFMLSMMILAFMLEIQTLSPQYSTFGTQNYRNPQNQYLPCNLKNLDVLKSNECTVSHISEFTNRISISFPFFSTIFYMSNWMLIIVVFFSLLYSIFSTKDDLIEDIEDDIFDDDDDSKPLRNKYEDV